MERLVAKHAVEVDPSEFHRIDIIFAVIALTKTEGGTDMNNTKRTALADQLLLSKNA
ncbi:hypothetical protein [Pacificoceanicola onchidii]|uniref:hypothetical protein n=1 Tax=Pacificoceanicola onchidii TaxID=2562685 RepID=UPI0014561F75|nr:hypothetical protein [Pacificoceanicola onchidii]